MIARGSELAAVERFARTSAERPVVLVLEGEPGIGKTTLWEAGIEAASDPSSEGGDVRTLHNSELRCGMCGRHPLQAARDGRPHRAACA